jgi:hypothetical protein
MKILTVLFCLCVPLMGADKKPLTKEELANQGKLRDLDINIAMRHI